MASAKLLITLSAAAAAQFFGVQNAQAQQGPDDGIYPAFIQHSDPTRIPNPLDFGDVGGWQTKQCAFKVNPDGSVTRLPALDRLAVRDGSTSNGTAYLLETTFGQYPMEIRGVPVGSNKVTVAVTVPDDSWTKLSDCELDKSSGRLSNCSPLRPASKPNAAARINAVYPDLKRFCDGLVEKYKAQIDYTPADNAKALGENAARQLSRYDALGLK